MRSIFTITRVMRVVDIHTHILPGIDDGAKDVSEAVSMVSMQKKIGVNKIILTPHYNPYDDLDVFLEKRSVSYSELTSTLNDSNVEFLLGCEVLYSSKLLDLDLDKLTLGDTGYILIEFGYGSPSTEVIRTFETIINSGYTPILAHVERYSFIRDNLDLLYELASIGVLTQFNAEVFLNEKERSFLKACEKHNLIHLLGSDAHGVARRAPNLGEVYSVISPDLKDYVIDNAQRVFFDRPVQVRKPSKVKKIFNIYI